MAMVRGVVTRWWDDWQPGFVEFLLTDVDGVDHLIHEKVPALTIEELTPATAYPRELWIDADVLSRGTDYADVRLCWDVQTDDGRTDFTVPLSSIRAGD